MTEDELLQPPAAAKYIADACQTDPELRMAIAACCEIFGAEDLYDLAAKMPEMVVELAQTQWMVEQQESKMPRRA